MMFHHMNNIFLFSTNSITISLCFSAAQNVQLKDESFPETDFEVVAGNLDAFWERIAPYPFMHHAFLV